ncbi:MAG TPA: hypothetical protein VK978_04065, partial [Candidatus Saccharimonadales bacterium]|nr:hypothetical protein [Candidatus Saccharimonadales bacterium]
YTSSKQKRNEDKSRRNRAAVIDILQEPSVRVWSKITACAADTAIELSVSIYVDHARPAIVDILPTYAFVK